ncbi:hypothetical protein ACSBR1_004780 [Camellia fascicularis]
MTNSGDAEMSEFNLNEAFWEELEIINLEDILVEHHTSSSASPEGWGDSEGMFEINLDEAFWDELGAINLDEILAEHLALASPEG